MPRLASLPNSFVLPGLLLLGLLAVSAYLRTNSLGESLWMDEGLSIGIASQPLFDIPSILRMDGSPPLYYMLLSVWMDLVGDGPAATQALSAAISLVAIPGGLWAGWSLFGRRAGLFCAAMCAVNPFLTQYAQETRMYSLMLVMSLLATAAFLHVFGFGRRRYLPLFMVLLAGMLYTHNWGLFLGAGLALGLIPCWYVSEVRSSFWKDALIGFGGVALLYLPWLPTLLHQVQHTGAPWLNPPNFGAPVQITKSLLGGGTPTVALLLAGGSGVAAILARRVDDKERTALISGAVIVMGTLVAAAVLAIEAGREVAWASSILERAVAPSADTERRPYNSEIRYYAPALASLGWVGLASRGLPSARAELLDLAVRGDRPIITALGSSLDRLHATSDDLAESLVRVAFQASIHPERHWDDSDADTKAKEDRERRLREAIEAELSWLQGRAPKPGWPEWPRGRRVKDRGSTKWDELEEDESEEAVDAAKPDSWVNEQEAGAWLQWIARSTVVRKADWTGELMEHYRDWTFHEYGLGLPPRAEIANPPVEWLRPFIQLSVRRGDALAAQRGSKDLVSAIVTLPDESFLDAAAIMLLYSDALHIDAGEIPVDQLVALREIFLERLLATRFLQWSRSDKSETIITDLAELVAAFLCHSWMGFGGARCYAPEKSETLLPVTIPILALVRAVPGWGVVTGLFLTLWEKGQDWLPLEGLLDAADAWASVRGDEPAFWRDADVGDRIVAWVDRHQARGALLHKCQQDRLIRILDLLAKAGVSSALGLEARLTAAPMR